MADKLKIPAGFRACSWDEAMEQGNWSGARLYYGHEHKALNFGVPGVFGEDPPDITWLCLDLSPGLKRALKIVEGVKRRDMKYGGTTDNMSAWMSDDPDGDYIDRDDIIATIESEIAAQGEADD